MLVKRTPKKASKGDICNLAELLSLMSFYQQVDTRVATPVLLKYSGFKINGLRGIKHPAVTSDGHCLAWHDLLSVGLCFCGWKGTEGWSYDMTSIQYRMHTRRAIDKTN